MTITIPTRKSVLGVIRCQKWIENTNDGVVDRVHLRVHRERLATPLLRVVAIVMGAIVVVPGGKDLSPLHKDGSQRKTHRALRRRVLALIFCEPWNGNQKIES